jgi:hypothetical protein
MERRPLEDGGEVNTSFPGRPTISAFIYFNEILLLVSSTLSDKCGIRSDTIVSNKTNRINKGHNDTTAEEFR